MKVFGVGQENGRRGATHLALLQARVPMQPKWNRESICRRSIEAVIAAITIIEY